MVPQQEWQVLDNPWSPSCWSHFSGRWHQIPAILATGKRRIPRNGGKIIRTEKSDARPSELHSRMAFHVLPWHYLAFVFLHRCPVLSFIAGDMVGYFLLNDKAVFRYWNLWNLMNPGCFTHSERPADAHWRPTGRIRRRQSWDVFPKPL